MKVFKFGGASVKDADAVRNVATIVELYKGDNLVIVVSAMGKTTNALEKIVEAVCSKSGEALVILQEIRNYHLDILEALFPDKTNAIYDRVNNLFVEIEWAIEDEVRSYDFVYDQIVSMGEVISTSIVQAWLAACGLPVQWFDIRDGLRSDNTWREGKIDWNMSQLLIDEKLKPELQKPGNMVVTQGFIAGTSENYTTTLGREGSDYTAAILAYLLNAESVTIWKDVPGVLNADPKYFADAQKLEQLSYLDAIELAYFGASVIHPKTIKPLENKDIPLHVKSFVQPQAKGTVIGKDLQTKPLIPSFIFKNNQVLISIAAKDFSFIAEDNLSDIFGIFSEMGVKLNLMQNSAISFSVCIDDHKQRLPGLIERLKKDFRVRYNDDLQLYTIRHYYPSTLENLSQGHEILLEQRSRNTAQLVMKKIEK